MIDFWMWLVVILILGGFVFVCFLLSDIKDLLVEIRDLLKED